jgi:midasin
VILDELNLARSEILEHLNRLLDDNQELFLPETQTVLRPHRRFRIFATQNPVTYAGRKMLSKAFRNRFIQINVGDIQVEDMAAILRRRCVYVPPSHVPLMLQTYREVNLHRSSEHLLMQRCGMITLRDLIKWGTRM